jgi:tetratricopeptide (TPR) repeat protein
MSVQFDLAKGGYSQDEILSLYALGKLFVESGDLRNAETIFRGLTAVEPSFVSAWIALAYVALHRQNFEEAIYASRHALRMDQDRTEALIFLVSAFLELGDRTAAGTHLGELRDHVEAGRVEHPRMKRLFHALMVRLS